jgi:hypothetical protein
MNYNSVLLEILVSLLGVVILVMGLMLPRAKKVIVGYFSAICLVGILIFSFIYSFQTGQAFYKGYMQVTA